MDDNVVSFPEVRSKGRNFCIEELDLLHVIADWLTTDSGDWSKMVAFIEARYPYFLDCYRVARLMNPSNPNPTRSALRASRNRAARDRT